MKRVRNFLHYILIRRGRWTLGMILMLIVGYYFCLPDPLFDRPVSTILEDREEQLLGARIAADGQWRFPEIKSVPEKFQRAITTFEDQRFFDHGGVDLRALLRALKQNLANQKVVSGGSTLSMQVIRLSRPGKPRSVFQKLIEMVLATRLEWRHNKQEIMSLYASHAPMGGNVVGLEAASWRYYGKGPDLLSWSEAATLAVLPNSPALIHPGRNRDALRAKRDRLLDRLLVSGQIDKVTCELAKEEALPDKPRPLPMLAPHLLDKAKRNGSTHRISSSLDRHLQQRVNRILTSHQEVLRANGVHNMAAVVIDIGSGQVRAYVGNTPGAGFEHGESVDILQAPRSTGSILKPFLYAHMLNEGLILPDSWVTDTPFQLNGYKPENYHRSYDGLVGAKRSLIRSLNVPMVRLLQDYGVDKFKSGLNKMGIQSIDQPADHYGLTLILGGAEASLWEITSAYLGMARTLRNFYPQNGHYHPYEFQYPKYTITEDRLDSGLEDQPPVLSAAAIWQTFEAMQRVERPGSEGDWQYFDSQQQIAWKTGTSFGFRDAWAVGISADYVVGVWTGNADGEGRPGLTGIRAAAPALFDVFEGLPQSDWFEQPFDEMRRIAVCQNSGQRAGPYCPVDSTWVTTSGLRSASCGFHQLVHLDAGGQFRVHGNCASPQDMIQEPWLVIPPVAAHYFQRHSAVYTPLPPYRSDCEQQADEAQSAMAFIYPAGFMRISLPVDLDGQQEDMIVRIAHERKDALVHWHLDGQYLGSTRKFHHLSIRPQKGAHTLTAVDDQGIAIRRNFEIVEAG